MQRKFMQRVAANVGRLAAMLDDLIQITFLDTGRFSLQPQPVDVVEVIEDALTSATNQLREKGLTVHLSLEDDLPPARGDRDALSEIVGQLLTNAYLASPPGSEIFITAKQQIVNRQTNGHKEPVPSLFVSIEDRGGGIAAEDQPRVFARKYKAENPLIQGLGDTGVGLAIARALVEAHSGEVWLETHEGIGSAFNFTVPLAPAPETEVERE
jgi:signal transduction histidine kinase